MTQDCSPTYDICGPGYARSPDCDVKVSYLDTTTCTIHNRVEICVGTIAMCCCIARMYQISTRMWSDGVPPPRTRFPSQKVGGRRFSVGHLLSSVRRQVNGVRAYLVTYVFRNQETWSLHQMFSFMPTNVAVSWGVNISCTCSSFSRGATIVSDRYVRWRCQRFHALYRMTWKYPFLFA